MERRYVKRTLGRKKGRPVAYRKWNESEVARLLDYLKSEPHENASERIYYTRFLEKYEMDKSIDWQLVKNKVRSLKDKYLKAVEWRAKTNSIGLQRICPLFNDLNEVFCSEVTKVKSIVKRPAEESAPETTHSLDSLSDLGLTMKIEIDDTELNENNYESMLPTLAYYNSDNNNDRTAGIIHGIGNAKAQACHSKAPMHKKIASGKHSTVNGVTEMTNGAIQSTFCDNRLGSLNVYQRELLQIQKARLTLEEQKFAFEKEKSLKELELRKRELEKDERMKILEIKSRERIAMKELEYKYTK